MTLKLITGKRICTKGTTGFCMKYLRSSHILNGGDVLVFTHVALAASAAMLIVRGWFTLERNVALCSGVGGRNFGRNNPSVQDGTTGSTVMKQRSTSVNVKKKKKKKCRCYNLKSIYWADHLELPVKVVQMFYLLSNYLCWKCEVLFLLFAEHNLHSSFVTFVHLEMPPCHRHCSSSSTRLVKVIYKYSTTTHTVSDDVGIGSSLFKVTVPPKLQCLCDVTSSTESLR